MPLYRLFPPTFARQGVHSIPAAPSTFNSQPTTIFQRTQAASRNREAIKSQMVCDLQRLHLITPLLGIKRRLPEINSPHRKAGGVKRIANCDMRHFFETRSIEQGMDIPTASRWLEDQDGGAICLKAYGYLPDEHSRAQALKVAF